MAYWSIAVLLVSVSFLAYRHSSATSQSLPSWLRPGRRRKVEDDGDEIPAEPAPPVAEDASTSASHVTIDVIEPPEAEKTPKATSTEPGSAISILSLEETPGDERKKSSSSKPTLPSFPAADSAQRALPGSRSPKMSVTPAQTRPAGLMPPPPRPTLVPPPSTASSLRVPSTGPLPNRGPPANSQQRISSGLSPNGAVSIPKARGKVLLAPGHSPMDWAALTRSKNLSGVSTFQRVTPSILKSMTGRKGKPAWTSWQGKVYNITPYLPFHPGGEAELMKAAGRDGANLFMEVHPWVNWENMLGTCLVGALVPENDGMGIGESLDDMD